MTCPRCADFDATLFPALKSRYIDIGGALHLARVSLQSSGGRRLRARALRRRRQILRHGHVLFALQKDCGVPKPLPPLIEIAKEAVFTPAKFDASLAETLSTRSERSGTAR